ncbi:DUF2281 domain-containing protein [Candidatus Gracilibacteria bacterium]|nr:DUF2281 domain-containing protein [Candidatus Gracilibacteria bacterium]
MTTAERHIMQLVEKLPPSAQAELLDFAEFLVEKHGKSKLHLSVMDILSEPLNETGFQNAAEVKAYLGEERDAWER